MVGIELWCNGNTIAFGAIVLGSSPDNSASCLSRVGLIISPDRKRLK